MAYKTQDGSWRVQRRLIQDGRYVLISKNFPNKAMAERFEANLLIKKYEDPTSIAVAKSVETFEEFAERWQRDYCRIEKAESQWVEDECVIRNYLVPEIGKIRMTDLRKKHLQALRAKLSNWPRKNGKPIKARTANNVLSLAKTIMSTAAEWEDIPSNPFSTVRPLPTAEQPFDYWMPTEREHFSKFARIHDPDFTELVVVASHTGLRRGELKGLKRKQLDFEKRQIMVNASFCYKAGKRFERTKNKQLAFIPMNEAVYAVLKSRQLMKPEADVFEVPALIHAAKRLKALCKEVGVKPIRFHDLRHTFASCLVMAGVPLYTVQRLMRHKTPMMTQRYAHLAPSYLLEAAESIVTNQTIVPDLSPRLVRSDIRT